MRNERKKERKTNHECAFSNTVHDKQHDGRIKRHEMFSLLFSFVLFCFVVREDVFFFFFFLSCVHAQNQRQKLFAYMENVNLAQEMMCTTFAACNCKKIPFSVSSLLSAHSLSLSFNSRNVFLMTDHGEFNSNRSITITIIFSI